MHKNNNNLPYQFLEKFYEETPIFHIQKDNYLNNLISISREKIWFGENKPFSLNIKWSVPIIVVLHHCHVMVFLCV